MTQIIAIAATTNEPYSPLTLSQLKSLADSSPGALVLVEFDSERVVGSIDVGVVTTKGLEVTGNINVNPIGFYLVPGFRRPDYKVLSYSLTRSPKDKTLTGIRQI